MSTRRSSSHGLSRWLAGLIILVVTIGAFTFYQNWRSEDSLLPTIISTNTPNPTVIHVAIQPKAAPGTNLATSVPPPLLKVLSDKAGFVAEITEVYLAHTDGWDLTHLDSYVGHLQGTARLGQGGNFVLAGHVELKDGRPGPFAKLKTLTKGDPILLLKSNGGQSQMLAYSITEAKVVKPDDFEVLRNHGFEELTLITCDDWNQQDRTYHSRVVIHARLITGNIQGIPKG